MWESGKSRERGTLPLSVDINVTNLVDVAFTLLVIFIITAPMLQGGIDVRLPQTQSTPITASEGVIITVAKDGKIYLGDLPVESLDELAQRFPDFVKSKKTNQVFLKGDQDVPYGRVLQVFTTLLQLNVAEVALVVEPPARRR
jgi:biopolymer transport protein TolR